MILANKKSINDYKDGKTEEKLLHPHDDSMKFVY